MKTKLTTLMMSLALLAVHAAVADGIKWTGGTNDVYWTSGSNWDGNIAPANDQTTDYAIFEGAAGDFPAIAGTLNIGGLKFNSGGWQLNGGTLNLGFAQVTGTNIGINASGMTGGINIINTTLALTGNQTWLVGAGGTMSFNTVMKSSSSGNEITIGDGVSNGTVIFSGAADNQNLALRVNSGLVIFDKSGAATVHSAGSGLTIQGTGTVRLAGTNNDQIYDGLLDVYVLGGGVLDMNGRNESIANLNSGGSNTGGLITNSNAAVSSTLRIAGNFSVRTYRGDFSGNLTLIVGEKNNNGDRDSGGANYSGVFTNSGDIIYRGSAATANFTLSGSVNNSGQIVNQGAGGAKVSISGNIGPNVTAIIQDSDGTSLDLSGTNFSTCGLTVKNGTVYISNRALGVDNSHHSGAIVLGDTANTGKAATLNINNNGIGNTGAGSNPFEIVGTGSRTITATSYSGIFSGLVTLHDGIELNLVTNNSRGSQLTFSGGFAGAGDLTLQVTNAAKITANSSITLSGGGVNIAGSITNSGAGTADNLDFLNVTISAAIGASVTGVTQDSAYSRLILSASNAHTADTTVKQGTLRLSHVDAVRHSTLNVTNGAVELGGAGTYNVGALQGAADAVVNTQAGNLSVGGKNLSTQFDGAISGNGGLEKVGTGTLTLSGENFYKGNTTVSGGVLLINGGGSVERSAGIYASTGGTFRYDSAAQLTVGVLLDGGAFHYNSAANFDGLLIFDRGKLAGTNWRGAELGALTVSAGQIIAPGNGIGAAVTDAQTWANGGAFEFELGNALGTAGVNWDLLTVSGALDISSLSAASFTLNLTGVGLSGFDAAQNYDWDFVHYNSLTGNFSSGLFSVSDADFGAAYGGIFSVMEGGGGLVLHYEAIPEPSAWALMLGGAIILLMVRKLRARSALECGCPLPLWFCYIAPKKAVEDNRTPKRFAPEVAKFEE